MHICQDGGHFEQRKHRTDINETQYSSDGDATLCIAAANTTLNCYCYSQHIPNFVARSFLKLKSCRYSTEKDVPKITTHYTIVPRETDPRWKGLHFIIFSFQLTSNITFVSHKV